MADTVIIDLGEGRLLRFVYFPGSTRVEFCSRRKDEGDVFELDRAAGEQVAEALYTSPMLSGDAPPAQELTWEQAKAFGLVARDAHTEG